MILYMHDMHVKLRSYNTSNATIATVPSILPKVINKKILVIGTGLAGVGKTTHLKGLSEKIVNSIYLDKDVVNLSLLQGRDYFSDYYNQYVKKQSYEVLLRLAQDNLMLVQDKIVILDGYFGDKLTDLKAYLFSPNFTTKVIYFHCSANRQLARLRERANIRDSNKLLEEDFVQYRQEHLKKHLIELSQVPHLIIDTEKDQNLKGNIENIYQYLVN